MLVCSRADYTGFLVSKDSCQPPALMTVLVCDEILHRIEQPYVKERGIKRGKKLSLSIFFFFSVPLKTLIAENEAPKNI